MWCIGIMSKMGPRSCPVLLVSAQSRQQTAELLGWYDDGCSGHIMKEITQRRVAQHTAYCRTVVRKHASTAATATSITACQSMPSATVHYMSRAVR